GFTLTADGCAQQALAPGASCSVQVGFDAAADGSASATLMIPTNSQSEASITAVPLSASVGSKLSSAAPSVALGSVPLETTSLATVAFSNRAATPQQVASVTVSNAQIAALSANECANATLAPGAACSVTVAVTPLVEGPFTVAVSANTGGANDVAYTVALNGSAVVAPKNTATANPAPAAASGGGGCTILRGEAAAPDATLAALAIFALLWRRARRRVLS
ncbi:MAG TPA: choice-of-anchor D domain-containing protein, partial [Burkholderiaceae bacterium]|nr:choice-of-anchor D domain-containing protein [Burkholderiaceae bacterium]